MRVLKLFPVFLIISFFLISCREAKNARIWTDRPEFALYGELFNSLQSDYKVSVKYYENPGQALEKTRETVDIIAASRLNNSGTGTYFRSLDNQFGANKLSRSIFYQKLLYIGRIERDQYLLPVSFNLPALIFSKEKELELENALTMDFDEVKALSKEYNTIARGSYIRMGFSPLWSNDFLYLTANLLGASFKEDSPVSWNSAALEQSMDFINRWTSEINSGNQAEEDFTFKYFVEPADKLIQYNRILFSYINSRDLFILDKEIKNELDYRWIMEKDNIPVYDDLVFLGMPKKAKAKEAARAFIHWFFNADTQELILQYCANNRINENVFGILGGFSALTQVTEEIFPRFYPELAQRMPSSDNFMTPNVLPVNWDEIKERVILPYLHDRGRSENTDNVFTLERRMSDWIRMNR